MNRVTLSLITVAMLCVCSCTLGQKTVQTNGNQDVWGVKTWWDTNNFKKSITVDTNATVKKLIYQPSGNTGIVMEGADANHFLFLKRNADDFQIGYSNNAAIDYRLLSFFIKAGSTTHEFDIGLTNPPFYFLGIGPDTTEAGPIVQFYTVRRNASGYAHNLELDTDYHQSGTASNADFAIYRDETSIGSGQQMFAQFQLANVPKYIVGHEGHVWSYGSVQSPMSFPPTYTTLNAQSTNDTWTATSNGPPATRWFGHFDADQSVVYDSHIP